MAESCHDASLHGRDIIAQEAKQQDKFGHKKRRRFEPPSPQTFV